MSSVDNRIVEMQFNNKRFEENAKQSMSTLDKLKEKLNFKNETKVLDEFQNSADSFNLNRIATAVESIGDKFTFMGNLGYQAMQRIAGAAINLGTNLVKSISIDQISAGMQKYEEETNTVQTLYASLRNKGKSLEDIYGVLERLGEYSDETSYSYTQMASAMSMFVNAGQDIDRSQIAMEGIANAAALAGVSIQDARIAFRNFSDAMGKGGFQLMDWKSLQNIHMDTEELKNNFIQTAIELGRLQEGGYYTHGKGKNKKKEQVTATNFSEFLRYGIFDSEVIMKTMEKYADRTTELGSTAFAAAQNAKTFTDVLDATKDSVSTGWKKTFRLIFGDLNEAIDLFTPMANEIIDFTSTIDKMRNTMFGKWKDLGGRDNMLGAMRNVWEAFKQLSNIFDFSFMSVFYATWEEMEELGVEGGGFWNIMGYRLKAFTEGIENATKAFRDWMNGINPDDGNRRVGDIQRIFTGLLSVVNFVIMALEGVGTFIGDIFDQLKPTFDALLDLFGFIGDDLLGLNKDLKKQKGFTELAKNLAAIFKPLTNRLPGIIKKLKQFYIRLKDIWNNNKRFVAFRKSVENVFNSFVKFIPNAIDSLINFGKKFIEMIKNSDEWKALVTNYNKYIKPVLRLIEVAATAFNNSLANFFNMDTSDETTLWGKIKKRFSAFENLGPYLYNIWTELKRHIPWLQDIETWWNSDPVINEIKEWVSQIAHAVDTFLSADTSGETSIVGKIKARFKAMWEEVGPWLSEKWNQYKEKYPILQQIEDFLKNLFGWGKPAEKAAEKAEGQTGGITSLLQQAFDKISELVGKIDPGKLLLFGGAIMMLIKVYKKVKTLLGWASLGERIGGVIDSVGDTIGEMKKAIKRNKMLQTMSTVLAVALSIWLLGDTLAKVSKLSWEEIAKGLTAMAGLFVEQGAFMILMTKFNTGKGKAKPLQLIGTAVSMWILGKALKTVADLSWDQIGRGLTAMAGLFAETGAFMILVNRFGKTGLFKKKGTSATSMIGLAVMMWILGNTLQDLANLTWDQIGKGLTAMGGLFLESGAFMIIVNRFGKTRFYESKATTAGSMIGLAVMMKSLGDTLKDLANMTWDQIGRGLSSMGGLFLESGAFMILVNRLSGGTKAVNLRSTLGTAGSIYILADKMKALSEMGWEEIGKGLAAMAGLFVEEGAFMTIIGLLSKKDLIKPDAVNLTTGILAGGIGSMGESMAKLGKLSWDKIARGATAMLAIEVLLGVYVAVMSKVEKVKIRNSIGMVLIAGAMYIMAKAFEPLAKLSLKEIGKGILALAAVAVALGVFCYAMSGLKMSVKTVLGVLVGAISMAALMVAFAFAVSLIKDVDATTIVAFGAAMILVSGAMALLSKALETFSGMSVGAAAKGALIMVIVAAALAAAIALILLIVGSAVENFSNNIAVVGANLAQYSDQVANIDMTAVENSVTMIEILATALALAGTKDYGNLETFRTNLTRISSSLKIFGLNTADLDTERMKTISGALKEMATDLAGFPAIGDVGTSVANIGGALKLYSESVKGVDLSTVPDTSSIQAVFETLNDAIPNDENLSNAAAFASEEKGNEMTNFAIGLTNIATAISSFSESAKTLDFTSIGKATEALTSMSKLNTTLETTTVKQFGPFAVEVSEQKESLSTFAEDIVALGTALNDFGTNISKVNTDDLTTGTTVLGKLVEVNNALPKTGGISQWITGTQNLTNFAANLRLLGTGAKDFSESVSGGTFNPTSVTSAGDALIKIAEVNRQLPKTGGISSWFTGDESLSGFGSSLKKLGEGVKEFAEALGETTITEQVTNAVGTISSIADIQIKMGNASSWYSMGTMAEELNTAAGEFVSLNSTITGVTWADTSGFEHILSFATGQQMRLGNKTFSKNLKDIGHDLRGFFDEIWGFTSTWTGGDSGKLDQVSSAVTSMFTELNAAFTNANSGGDYTTAGADIIKSLSEGINSESSISTATGAVQDVARAAWQQIHPTNDQNFYNIGTWIPAGIAEGIRGNKSAAINAAIEMAGETVTSVMDLLKMGSPSKVFAEIGTFSDMGFANGLNDSVGVVENAGKNVSQSAVGSILQGLADIQNLPLSDMDIQPTVRPVLDTSDISSKAGLIGGLLGGDRTIGFNTSELEARAQILGESSAPDLGGVTQRVMDLGAKLDTLNEAITHMQIVMNNGALVGAIAPDIDKMMASRERAAERGG